MILNTICGKSVKIRSVEKSDTEFTLSLRKELSISKYIPMLDIDIETQKKWISDQIESDDSYFIIIERLSGEKIGVFSIYDICEGNAQTGRLIMKGNQIETIETMMLSHDYAFNVIKINELYSMIYEDNIPASGLARQLGAVKAENFIYDKEKDKKIYKWTITKDIYFSYRPKIEKLVNRFAVR